MRPSGSAGYEIVLQDRKRTTLSDTLARARRAIGKRTGIIQYIMEGESSPDDFGLFKCYASLCQTARFSPVESSRKTGSGAMNWQRARAAAVGEALERYSLSLYEPSDLVFASYSEIKADALAPEQCVLFSERQYSRPGFGYARFSDDTKVNWVWGFSLVSQRPILIPACYVYVPYRVMEGEARIKCSVTTGGAAGSSLEEAILSGILEVIERDAFAITWLNKLPAPSVDLAGVKNPKLRYLVNRIGASSLKLVLRYIATDIEVPVFLGMFVDELGKKPVITVGAAANLDPEMAVLKALEEAILTRSLANMLVKEDERRGFLHLERFEDLKDFNDHVLLYAWRDDLGEAWEFLLQGNRSVALDELPNASSDSVLTSISFCLDKLAARGMDVIVTDVTTPDVAEAGFTVVKVVVPGLQPLNGNFNFRHLGGRRLYEVPKILGYTEEPTNEDDLNPYPHPFP